MSRGKSKRKDARVLKALQAYWPEVERVVDARNKLLVHVGPQDVQQAVPLDAANCVMARACQREQEVDAVLVFPTRAYILQGTLATRFSVPESTTREIAILDRGGAVAPGEYFFAPPPPKARMGAEVKERGLLKHPRRPNAKPIHLRTEGLRHSLLR